jgi:putative ABC transport system ATP-binding protein
MKPAHLCGDLLRKLAAEQKACIVTVTHDGKIFDRFDRLVPLRGGRLVEP